RRDRRGGTPSARRQRPRSPPRTGGGPPPHSGGLQRGSAGTGSCDLIGLVDLVGLVGPGRGRVLTGPDGAAAADRLAAGAAEHGAYCQLLRAQRGTAQAAGQGLAVVDVEGLLARDHALVLVAVLAGAARALDDPRLDVSVS